MKKILLLLLVIFLSGCSVKYDLVITDKKRVKENIEITVFNERIYEQFQTIDEFVNYYDNYYNTLPGYESFEIKSKKRNDGVVFNVSNKYSSLEEYIKSNSYISMFSGASIEHVGNYTTFKSTDNVYLQNINSEYIIDEHYYYDKFTINIQFYNKVVDHNADKVDTKNNVYTWEVTSSNPKEYVYFKFNDKKRYDVIIKDYIKTNYVSLIIIASLIVIVLIVGMIFYKTYRKNLEV